MIIFINGNSNSGKSTVAKLLRKKLDNPAVVEIDALRWFIEQVPISEAVSISWENAALIIRNFHNHGFNVIIPYPLARKYYEYITKELHGFISHMVFVTLNPNLDVLVTNRGSRELSHEEIERVKVLHDRGITDNSYGLVIDNSKQTPEETVAEILEYIKGDK